MRTGAVVHHQCEKVRARESHGLNPGQDFEEFGIRMGPTDP